MSSKNPGDTAVENIAQERLQAARLLLYHFGNICSKYEVSSLMRSLLKISEYTVWSRSNEYDTRFKWVKSNHPWGQFTCTALSGVRIFLKNFMNTGSKG